MPSTLGPEPKRSVGSADVGRLQGNAVSHPLPEVLSKVHLGLREHLVYDGFGDPALLARRMMKKNDLKKRPCNSYL